MHFGAISTEHSTFPLDGHRKHECTTLNTATTVGPPGAAGKILSLDTVIIDNCLSNRTLRQQQFAPARISRPAAVLLRPSTQIRANSTV